MIVMLAILASLAAPDDGRVLKKKSDYKAIVERNIFAPPRSKARPRSRPRPRKRERSKLPSPPPPPWVITGIFFHENKNVYRIIVEKKKSLKVLGVGDEIDGVKIKAVGAKTVTVSVGGKKQERSLGGKIPVVQKKSSESPAPEQEGDRKRLRKRGKKKLRFEEPDDN